MRKNAIRVVLIAALSLTVFRHHKAAAMPESVTKGKCTKEEIQAYIDLIDRILSERRISISVANQKLGEERPDCVVSMAELKDIVRKSRFFSTAYEEKAEVIFVFWRGWLWNYFEVGFSVRYKSMTIALPYGKPAVWMP